MNEQRVGGLVVSQVPDLHHARLADLCRADLRTVRPVLAAVLARLDDDGGQVSPFGSYVDKPAEPR